MVGGMRSTPHSLIQVSAGGSLRSWIWLVTRSRLLITMLLSSVQADDGRPAELTHRSGAVERREAWLSRMRYRLYLGMDHRVASTVGYFRELADIAEPLVEYYVNGALRPSQGSALGQWACPHSIHNHTLVRLRDCGPWVSRAVRTSGCFL
jgi:hypothetical protein